MSKEKIEPLQPLTQHTSEMSNQLQQSPAQQLTPNLTPQAQEAITMLNLRVNDLLTQLNIVLNILVKENAELKQQIEQQKHQ
jgi:hypothetical protein